MLRRLSGRSNVFAVPAPGQSLQRARIGRGPGFMSGRLMSGRSVSWQRWALAGVGVIQLGLAIAQALGAHFGLPHATMHAHLFNESTAWSVALGVVMLAAAARPTAAAGLAWVLGAFGVVLSGYVIADAVTGAVTVGRIVSHLPVVVGAVLALLVARSDQPADPKPGAKTGAAEEVEITLPDNATRGRRRGHLYPTDGSAA
jgi:predicted anti-sigma-YlaC factor YlaD